MNLNQIEKILDEEFENKGLHLYFLENDSVYDKYSNEFGKEDWIDPIRSIEIKNGFLIIDNGFGTYRYEIAHIEKYELYGLTEE